MWQRWMDILLTVVLTNMTPNAKHDQGFMFGEVRMCITNPCEKEAQP